MEGSRESVDRQSVDYYSLSVFGYHLKSSRRTSGQIILDCLLFSTRRQMKMEECHPYIRTVVRMKVCHPNAVFCQILDLT